MERQVLPKLSEAIIPYLDFLGVTPPSLDQMQQIRQAFLKHMDWGLDRDPRSSLQMIPTQLGEIKEMPDGKKALAIDCGGTGLKAAIYESRHGEPVETKRFRENQFNKTHWQADEFFDHVVDNFESTDEVDAIGFIFSFPGEAERLPNQNVDVRTTDKLTKDWEIAGIDQDFVGKQLMAALCRKFPRKKDKLVKLPLIVMNDTVAVLFSDPEAKAGGVNATGFNLAEFIEGMVRNIEAGNFYDEAFPISILANLFDHTTENYAKQTAEKQISGLGIEGQFKTFLKQTVAEDFLRPALSQNADCLKCKHVSAILSGQWDEVEIDMGCLLEEEEKIVLRAVAEKLVDRSAKIFSSLVAALGDKVNKPILKIPLEGSYFWLTPGYKEKVNGYLRELSPEKQFVFTGKEPEAKEPQRLGLKGASRVALSLVTPGVD